MVYVLAIVGMGSLMFCLLVVKISIISSHTRGVTSWRFYFPPRFRGSLGETRFFFEAPADRILAQNNQLGVQSRQENIYSQLFRVSSLQIKIARKVGMKIATYDISRSRRGARGAGWPALTKISRSGRLGTTTHRGRFAQVVVVALVVAVKLFQSDYNSYGFYENGNFQLPGSALMANKFTYLSVDSGLDDILGSKLVAMVFRACAVVVAGELFR